ncbi:EAL and HDOD domain-containing protein [Acetobacterium tundrae]|uniref:EAL domain-containing protein n=1 Tax=Acetobacterium tundrae TaxID=132932 RepID=A0ABR6WIE5_9FIRM|nr:EAL domain-containing protein [Acetobacterium tundrae]MBC3796222.1 EAL domain-containing protein [Acetobacterium tundrae]
MFIARQPIFNNKIEVIGYELLYRSGSQSKEYDGISSEASTASVINGLFESGLDSIIEDKCAFINFDEKFIHTDALELIDPDRLIVEMLEDVIIDALLTDRLKEVRKKGYRIALDDFRESYSDYPLIEYADIIKYDLIATPLESIVKDVNKALINNKIILAEKVETEEEFLKAKEMGFQLFQGYFFCKPHIASKSIDKSASKVQYIRIIAELKKKEPSFEILSGIVEQDVTLAYRFLRAVSFRKGGNLVYSIKTALTYMGLNEIERWINILMLQDLGKSKPQELMKISLIRSSFSASIAGHMGLESLTHEASLMGLLSVLDAILDQTMEEALEGIALPNAILEALIDHKGVLFPVYELQIAYEKADWLAAEKISKELNIDENMLFEDYLIALEWANDIVAQIE